MRRRNKNWGRMLAALGIGLTGALMVACDTGNSSGASSRMPVPPKGFVADVQQGKGLYRRFCASCHGRDMAGAHAGPALLHKIYEPGHHADLAFYMAVSKGVRQHHWKFGDMPPVSGVSPEDAGHIIAFIRAEQRKVGIQ